MRTTFDFDLTEARAASQFLFEKFPDLATIAYYHLLKLSEMPHAFLIAEANSLVQHETLQTRVIAISALLHLDVLSALDYITYDNIDHYMSLAEDMIRESGQIRLATRLSIFRAMMESIKDHAGLWKEFLSKRNYPELSVCNYLEELATMKATSDVYRTVLGPNGKGDMQRAKRYMQKAKIFDVDPHLYADAKDLLFSRTCGELDVDEDLANPRYEADHLMAMIQEWSIDAPMPEARPFDNVYIAYRAGVAMDQLESAKYFSRMDMISLDLPMDRYRIMGHLIAETGEVWTFTRGHLKDMPDSKHT